MQSDGMHSESPEQATAGTQGEHSSPSTMQATNRHACHLLQRPVAGCLAAHCGAHKHKAVPNKCGLVQLDALGNKAVHCLQAHLLAGLPKSLQQIAIVHLRTVPQLSLACLACALHKIYLYEANPSGASLPSYINPKSVLCDGC